MRCPRSKRPLVTTSHRETIDDKRLKLVWGLGIIRLHVRQKLQTVLDCDKRWEIHTFSFRNKLKQVEFILIAGVTYI